MNSKYNGMKFREKLPDRCPPDEAGPLTPQTLLRLVEGEVPNESQFDSHAALGFECALEGRECEWASCSMFLPSIERHKLASLQKFKRLKNKSHVAFISVDQSSGIAVIKPTKHVDLWMTEQFLPTQHVHSVVSLDSYEPS
jgi:hypothetical protein